jgi:hypothetical protein
MHISIIAPVCAINVILFSVTGLAAKNAPIAAPLAEYCVTFEDSPKLSLTKVITPFSEITLGEQGFLHCESSVEESWNIFDFPDLPKDPPRKYPYRQDGSGITTKTSDSFIVDDSTYAKIKGKQNEIKQKAEPETSPSVYPFYFPVEENIVLPYTGRYKNQYLQNLTGKTMRLHGYTAMVCNPKRRIVIRRTGNIYIKGPCTEKDVNRTSPQSPLRREKTSQERFSSVAETDAEKYISAEYCIQKGMEPKLILTSVISAIPPISITRSDTVSENPCGGVVQTAFSLPYKGKNMFHDEAAAQISTVCSDSSEKGCVSQIHISYPQGYGIPVKTMEDSGISFIKALSGLETTVNAKMWVTCASEQTAFDIDYSIKISGPCSKKIFPK